MAIYKDNEAINPIEEITEAWEGHTGKEVEDFISRRLKNPLGSNIRYEENILKLYNPEGEVIAQGPVTMVPPNYVTEVLFSQITVQGKVEVSDIEINYNDNTTFIAGINVKNYYESSGNKYNLSNAVNITFFIEGTTDRLIVENVKPNSYDDDSLQFIDITPLFKEKRDQVFVKASVSTENTSHTATYAGKITVHKIDISTASTHVEDQKVVFDIQGLTSTSGMYIEYFDVPLGYTGNLRELKTTKQALSGNPNRVEVTLTEGGHQLLARITNDNNTYYSGWIQANVVSWNKDHKKEMLAIIGGIPTVINNCENAKLFQIISVPGLGGTVDIVSYLADDSGIFSLDQSEWPEFNRTSISTNANDEPSIYDYYSYIELDNVSNASKAAAFSLVVNGVSYTLYSLTVVNGYLSGKSYFQINIQENPHNINKAFNHVAGAIEDFSQIKGQSTTLFAGANTDIEASDGWFVDSDLIAYKISGQGKNLFTTPKNLGNLLASSRGFTIEVMLKNYNINGDDPVMSIGNLLFGPGYTRVQSSNEEIYTNSRADFEKDVITHLTFVYDPAYKPTTYNNIYDQLFTDKTNKYSTFNYTYPILKVYVNGSINREIELKTTDLANNDGFNLQINPSSSDLNLYLFRTYNWAFNYNEIQKNWISSRPSSEEKKAIYDRNNILGEDGRVSFYKTMQNHNVIVVVIPENDKPLYFGNRKTNGDGVDPSNPDENAKATLLVHYKDEAYKDYCGRFTGGKYKAQGSSAKKYMIHNVQYSKGNFISEADIAAGKTETSSKYAMPTDSDQIQAKKFVGKVNYASSMQSHKLGSVKLFDKAYKQSVFKNTYQDKLYTGGKKACLEEAFVYFYYNVKPGQDINTITLDDLYTVDLINNIEVPSDQDVKFFGFQTWGSGKADDPTFGYGDDTPEYLLVEGADNGSAGANFKQPWAAFQTWTSTETYDTHKQKPELIKQQTSEITDPTSSKYDPTVGLLIEGETIKFDSNGTDPWDIDYGVTELDEAKDLWKFKDEVKAKGSSLHHWVEFYNNCYTYDFTNLVVNPNSNAYEFDVTNRYGSDDYGLVDRRIYMKFNNTKVYDKDSKGTLVQIGLANKFDMYRWDSRINKWVPGGLHYDGSKWAPFNLKTVFENIPNTTLYAEYKDNTKVMTPLNWLGMSISDPEDVNTFVVPAFKDMFKANVEKYCDRDDIVYHQAFIRLVSGTDNRAKNTYFQIIGKKYEKDETSGTWNRTDVGDYKIRLMQDDMDTIFATDNNGQQVKPYYLLEPAFNKDTEKMWGDHHSSFFYPFDICYYNEINNTLGQIIDYLVGSVSSVKDPQTLLYDYFFKTQLEFPEILYNHHAEIYYEMPQVLFKENKINAFSDILSGFANNSVQYPLSLSHGRCIESEYQFMKDRLLLLGTQSNSAHNLYGTEWQFSSEGSGGNEGGTEFKGTAEFTDYLYPTVEFKRSNGEEYSKIVNLTDAKEVAVNYDRVFDYVLPASNPIPSTVAQLVTPDKEYALQALVDTTITSYLSSADKIKSMSINAGLKFMHYLPTLPNTKYLNIDGIATEYKVNSIDIKVKDYMPIIEELVITNTPFSNSVLDLRGCTRLTRLNLSGCTGISDIIFPESNRLSEVLLPTGIKKLTIGNTPNLSTLVIAEGTQLTELSLDCSNLHEEFDYMHLLTDCVDYNNVSQFILKNTSAELPITETLATRLASIAKQSGVLISGKYIVKDRDEEGKWGSPTNISYITKKRLAEAFGNIDSTSNRVYIKYEITELMYDSRKLDSILSVDVPSSGIRVKPFDVLYFSQGNNVKITNDGNLDVTYSITGLPSTCTFNTVTGELYADKNTDKSYQYSVTVKLMSGTTLPPITGTIKLGYIEPAIGDFAYSDGTFSSLPNTEKTVVGIVFQKEVITTGEKWKLGILSNKVIKDYSGPAYYSRDAQTGNWSKKGQGDVNAFMKAYYSIPDIPTVSAYVGVANYAAAASDITTVIKYDTYSDDPNNDKYPKKLVTSGSDNTKVLADSGMDRIRTFAMANSTFRNYLISNGFMTSQNALTYTWSVKDLDSVFTKYNEEVNTIMKNTSDTLYPYHMIINPLAVKIHTFAPDNLSNSGVDYYAKGQWHIPSKAEIELLVWYRIISTVDTQSGGILTSTEAYWNSNNFSAGNSPLSIFSKIASASSDDKFTFQCLTNWHLISDKVALDNHNMIYGQHYYYSGSGYDRYGWHNLYTEYPQWTQSAHTDCARDAEYSIAPCCYIEVTKSR